MFLINLLDAAGCSRFRSTVSNFIFSMAVLGLSWQQTVTACGICFHFKALVMSLNMLGNMLHLILNNKYDLIKLNIQYISCFCEFLNAAWRPVIDTVVYWEQMKLFYTCCWKYSQWATLCLFKTGRFLFAYSIIPERNQKRYKMLHFQYNASTIRTKWKFLTDLMTFLEGLPLC